MPISKDIYSKIIRLIFSFPEFVLACKKSFYSIHSFKQYNQFQSFVPRVAKPMFGHSYSKTFKSTFSFPEFVSTFTRLGQHQHYAKSATFSQVFWENLFPKNLPLLCTTSYGFLTPCENLEKTKSNLQKMVRQKDRRKNERTDLISKDPSSYNRGLKQQKNYWKHFWSHCVTRLAKIIQQLFKRNFKLLVSQAS